MVTDATRESFDRQGNSVSAWYSQGANLVHVAGFLERLLKRQERGARVDGLVAVDLFLPALLLRAFGTECLLKTLWLARGGRLAERGKYKKIPGRDQHDLDGLARQARLPCSADERKTLRRLSQFSQRGRYPIVRDVEQERPDQTPTPEDPFPGDWSDDDWQRARDLVGRVVRLIYSLTGRTLPPIPPAARQDAPGRTNGGRDEAQAEGGARSPSPKAVGHRMATDENDPK